MILLVFLFELGCGVLKVVKLKFSFSVGMTQGELYTQLTIVCKFLPNKLRDKSKLRLTARS